MERNVPLLQGAKSRDFLLGCEHGIWLKQFDWSRDILIPKYAVNCWSQIENFFYSESAIVWMHLSKVICWALPWHNGRSCRLMRVMSTKLSVHFQVPEYECWDHIARQRNENGEIIPWSHIDRAIRSPSIS